MVRRFPYFIPRSAREQAAVERMRASASHTACPPEDLAAMRELLQALDPALLKAIRAFYVYGAGIGEVGMPPGMDEVDFRAACVKLRDEFRRRRGRRDRAPIARSTATPSVRPKALIVDGDAVSRLILLDVAQGCGMEPVLVTTVRDALDAMGRTPFSLILLDSRLRDGHGAQIAEAVFTSGRYGEPRIIAVSADSSAENTARMLEAGAERVLAKPVSAASLRALLMQDPRTPRANL